MRRCPSSVTGAERVRGDAGDAVEIGQRFVHERLRLGEDVANGAGPEHAVHEHLRLFEHAGADVVVPVLVDGCRVFREHRELVEREPVVVETRDRFVGMRVAHESFGLRLDGGLVLELVGLRRCEQGVIRHRAKNQVGKARSNLVGSELHCPGAAGSESRVGSGSRPT